MKKKITEVIQPEKVETAKPILAARHVHAYRLHHDHSFCDHSHGRVNRFPFGSSHGPEAF